LLSLQPAANGVKSGVLKLKPDQSTFENFADMGIAVEPKGDADFGGGAFVFPAGGGDIDPSNGYQGIIGGGGALKFSRESDGAKLKLKNVEAVIHKHKVDVGGTTKGGVFIKLAKATGYGILADDHTSFELKNGDTVLSRVGAHVLSETFGFPFHRGIPLGRLAIKAKITKHQVEE
jgi:hypothetical protein